MQDAAQINLALLRDHAWKHFVGPEDQRAFAEDFVIVKRHPLSGESLGTYLVLGDREFAASEAGIACREGRQTLSRADWTLVLCTGRCVRMRTRASMSGTRARCALGVAPLQVGCMAEALQMHPQAALLSARPTTSTGTD